MRTTVLVILVALTGCVGEPPGEGPGDGYSTPLWGEVGPTVSVEPLLQIGSRTGDGPDTFAGVANARFLASGKIVVSDSGAERLVVFNADGTVHAVHGQSGQGPGEFTDLARAYPYPGDSIAAFDFGNDRTLIFPEGAGESRAITARHRDVRAPIFGVLGSGALLAYQRANLRGPPIGEWDSTLVVRVERDGSESVGVGRVASAQYVEPQTGTRQILGPTSILVASDHGYYWARTDRYEIHFFDPAGGLLHVVTRPIQPAPIGPSEADEYREATIRDAREAGQSVERYERLYRDAEFASTRPLFQSGFVDHQQRLWVSEFPWPSRFAIPRAWSVFSPDGDWLGDVSAPEGVRVQDVRDGQILGIWQDEFGVDYVRVYAFGDG